MVDNLIEKEVLILNIIQEYLNKNRYLKINDIISIINSRFAKTSINLNDIGIKEIIKSLLKKNLIVEKSKFTRGEVLKNPNRKRIFEYIQQNPGIHFNKLYRDLDLSISVVEWHLNILMNFNFIRKETIDNYEAYFELNFKNKKSKLIHLVSREKYKKVIEFLKENNEGCTRYRLSKELKMHPNTINKYINNLEKYGLLFSKRLSNKTLYLLNEVFYENLFIYT